MGLSIKITFLSGNFSKLVIKFTFKRRMGYYLIQVYLPDSLVVAISWIVFWLEQDDMGGRVGLGITTILTIMFLLGSVNMSLPRVSYPKAIDWFLIGSFLMVFLVLVECIIVYILRPNKGGMNGISDRSTGSTGSTDLRLQSNAANEVSCADWTEKASFCVFLPSFVVTVWLVFCFYKIIWKLFAFIMITIILILRFVLLTVQYYFSQNWVDEKPLGESGMFIISSLEYQCKIWSPWEARRHRAERGHAVLRFGYLPGEGGGGYL